MPTRNINLTAQMDKFVDSKIRTGEYANASEVLRAGLRALKQTERDDQVKLDALRQAIIAGESSGVFEGDAVGQILKDIKRRGARIGEDVTIA